MSFRRHILSLFIVVVLMVTGLSAVLAQDASRLDITGASFTRCVGGVIEGSFGVTAYDAGGGIINSGSGISATVYATSNSGYATSDSWSYVSGSSVAFAFTFPGGLSYADIVVQSGAARSDVYRFGCDGTITRFGGGGGADARINRSHGDLTSALYAASDGSGNPTIRVYDIASDSSGVLRGDYAYKLFQPYLDNAPSSNTVLGRLGKTTLIALTTGEFQINVGPDAEGKIHEVVFTGMPPSKIHFSSYIGQ